MQKGIKDKDIRDFETCCQKLKSIMDRICEYAPEANIYISEGEINLMCDAKHDSNYRVVQKSVVTSIRINCIDGGGW